MTPSRAIPRSTLRGFGLLATAGMGLVLAYVLAPSGTHAKSVLSDLSLTVVFGLSAAIMLAGAGPLWKDQRRPIGILFVAVALLHLGFLVHELIWPDSIPFGGPSAADLAFAVPGSLVVVALWQEFVEHFRQEDRREAVADIFLVTVAIGGIVFLILQPEGVSVNSVGGDLSSAVFAASVVTPVAWGALAVWAPSRIHFGLFAAASALCAGSVGFGFQWIRQQFVGGQPLIDLPLGLAALAFAALLVSPATSDRTKTRAAAPRLGKPILTVTAVTAACASLALTAGMQATGRVSPLEAAVLIAMLATAVAFRILLNQVRTKKAADQVEHALAEKDVTLRETDATLQRLREVHESLTASEARMRLLFDVAVDGIVELDAAGSIRRANESFCTMIGVPYEEVMGRTWEELAGSVEGGGPSLQSLPVTGQTLLKRDGHELHLACRSSELPDPDPGRLLVIRDVSADKVAEMTIRSLFKFLQDRDEDRSRLLRRTNSAIEAERNRIARDLHDGPVQGISAASLSLEAVLLMLRTGDVEGGIEMLAKIREELSEEAEGLRRLMADLRPPVLEERGLIPALRDTLARFGRDFGVMTQFHSRALVEVPADLETLAYRIVQEALTNAAKHSGASDVTLTVEAEAGQLRVEVQDNGKGFEPEKSREFLRLGRVGLASMRERTELASGTFMVRSSPGGGTSVVATLPLEIVPTQQVVLQ